MLCVSSLHCVPPGDRDCVRFIFASWHNILSMIETQENFFFFGSEFRGLIIHILYKRNPEDIIFFCQYKSLEILT